jgi:hypothetical protein
LHKKLWKELTEPVKIVVWGKIHEARYRYQCFGGAYYLQLQFIIVNRGTDLGM